MIIAIYSHMTKSFLLLIALIGCLSLHGQTLDVIFQNKAATSLNSVTLYPDTSFTKHSDIQYKAGELFEIIGTSHHEHEDAAQNQKFKWYQVKTQTGATGWIYGDGLAVMLPDAHVEPSLRNFHKKRYGFNNGFEKAVLWVAAMEGRDNFHEQDYLNPLYKEFYLVLTNDQGRSVQVNYAGESAMGKSNLKLFQFYDVSGDKIPELIFQKSIHPTGMDFENRSLEIYSFQAGTLLQVFKERMTLNFTDKLPSPSLFKFIEIDGPLIRVEYIDYVSCSNYSLPLDKGTVNNSRERCMEFATCTYKWDERIKSYFKLYEESRSAPIAGIKQSGILLKEKPELRTKRSGLIKRSDQLQVIKHNDAFVFRDGKKLVDNHLLVRLPSGKTGYVLADKIGFVNTEHAALLHAYYSNTPIHKSKWKSSQKFLKIVSDPNASVYTK